MKYNEKSILWIAGCLIFIPEMAYAYIDPGTGSMIFQMLAAAVFGALFAIKVYWKKIKGFLNIGSSKPEEKIDENEK